MNVQRHWRAVLPMVYGLCAAVCLAQAPADLDEHEHIHTLGSYNRALRDARRLGTKAAGPAVIEKQLQERGDRAELSRAIATARVLRMSETAPSLRKVLDDANAAAENRIQAALALLKLEPGSAAVDGWLTAIIAGEFREWDGTQQELLLSVLMALPPEKTLKHARAIESWAEGRFNELENAGAEATPRLGQVGNTLAQTQRLILETQAAQSARKEAGEKPAAALVDRFVKGHAHAATRARVLETMAREKLKDAVVAEVRGRLAAADERTRAKLLLLLDELGVELSDEQLQQLESVFPPPPACG